MQENDPVNGQTGGGFQSVDPYATQPQPKQGLGTGRVLLIIFGALGACLLICVVAGFFLVRSIQSGFEEVVEDGINAVMVEQVGAVGAAQPGTYTISTEQVLAQLNAELSDEGANIDDLFVRILPNNQIVLGVTSEGQDLEYTATLNAVNGRLDVSQVEASNSFLNFIAPGGRIASGLEDGINEYLEYTNLSLTSISTVDGEITLVLE